MSLRCGHGLLICNSLGRQLVHLGAGGHHLDGELVHHQHPPVHLARGLVVPDNIVQDPCLDLCLIY